MRRRSRVANLAKEVIELTERQRAVQKALEDLRIEREIHRAKVLEELLRDRKAREDAAKEQNNG